MTNATLLLFLTSLSDQWQIIATWFSTLDWVYVTVNATLGLLSLLCICLGIWGLAHRGLFFTFCPEGHFVIIKQGESAHKLIASLKHYTYNKWTGRFIRQGDTSQIARPAGSILGIYWLGIPFIHYRHHAEVYLGNGKQEMSCYFPFREMVPVLVEAAETGRGIKAKDKDLPDTDEQVDENIALDIQIEVTIEVVDGFEQRMVAPNYRQQLNNYVESVARGWVKMRTHEEVSESQEQSQDEDSLISAIISYCNFDKGGNKRSLPSIAGIEVTVVNIAEVAFQDDVADAMKKVGLEKAALQRAVVESERKEVEGKGDAAKLKETYLALERHLNQVGITMKASPGIVAYLTEKQRSEAIANTKLTTLIVGTPPAGTFVDVPTGRK